MEAFSELDSVHPEALLQVFSGMVGRVRRDEGLRGLLENKTEQTSPQKVCASGAGAGAKLVLAQNNPHLKSHHRRRQSAIVQEQSHAEQQRPAAIGHRAEMMSKADLSSPRSVTRRWEGKETRREKIGEDKEEKGNENEMRLIRELVPGGEEADVDGNMKGMEHVALLGDVLFERWCEGLKGRWGGNSGVV